MERRIGIIAGSGKYPFLALEEAHKLGYICVVAAIKGEADTSLKDYADIFTWLDAGEVLNCIAFFKRNRISEAVFAGKIDPRIIYQKKKFDETSLRLLAKEKEKSPSVIIKTVIDFMTKEGVRIRDPSLFLSSYFCQEGILTKTEPSSEEEQDISFGWKIAKKVADLDIGQTVIIKDRTVVAVEGMEGTDEVIKRGGLLGGKGTIVVKVCRSFQDARIDLPAVGLNTIKNLVKANARALCFEAQTMPFFQKKEAISFADSHKISIVVKKS